MFCDLAEIAPQKAEIFLWVKFTLEQAMTDLFLLFL